MLMIVSVLKLYASKSAKNSIRVCNAKLISTVTIDEKAASIVNVISSVFNFLKFSCLSLIANIAQNDKAKNPRVNEKVIDLRMNLSLDEYSILYQLVSPGSLAYSTKSYDPSKSFELSYFSNLRNYFQDEYLK